MEVPLWSLLTLNTILSFSIVYPFKAFHFDLDSRSGLWSSWSACQQDIKRASSLDQACGLVSHNPGAETIAPQNRLSNTYPRWLLKQFLHNRMTWYKTVCNFVRRKPNCPGTSCVPVWITNVDVFCFHSFISILTWPKLFNSLSGRQTTNTILSSTRN